MLRAMAFLLLVCLLSPEAARGASCEDAAIMAEEAAGLPAGLLAAIGRVESGRRGPDGRMTPWPWSVNAAGEGHYLATADAAIALVASLRARGITSIDVGCFQVNLLFHADAFASLADAFEPAANARAAAGFLRTLLAASSGLWDAVGRYHSGNPARGLPYAQQVIASWQGGAAMAVAPVSQVASLARVFAPGTTAFTPTRDVTRLPALFVPARSQR